MTAAAEAAAVLRLAKRFHELRRDCDAGGIFEIRPGNRPDNRDTTMVHWITCPGLGCEFCDGVGWLPVSAAEALYWLLSQPDAWICGSTSDSRVWPAHGPIPAGSWAAQWSEKVYTGPTPLLAVAAAVEAAQEGENAIQ